VLVLRITGFTLHVGSATTTTYTVEIKLKNRAIDALPTVPGFRVHKAKYFTIFLNHNPIDFRHQNHLFRRGGGFLLLFLVAVALISLEMLHQSSFLIPLVS